MADEWESIAEREGAKAERRMRTEREVWRTARRGGEEEERGGVRRHAKRGAMAGREATDAADAGDDVSTFCIDTRAMWMSLASFCASV